MLFCVSVSHKQTSLSMLESLSFPSGEEAARAFCEQGTLAECVLLQTCHRIEIYGVTADFARGDAVDVILRSWSSRAGVSFDVLRRVFELYDGREALAHLFSLAAGLESMVVGEDQILGQVRSAYVEAKRAGSAGRILDKVFMKAVNTGRRVRTETGINEGSVSVSSAAVDLAVKELGGLESATALVIGAGEAGSIAAETLQRRGAKRIVVANRTRERGEALALKVSGRSIGLDGVYDEIPSVDLVISAVSVKKPILEASRLRSALGKSSSGKRLLVVDISQPRAVDAKAGSIRGLVLRNIEDLKGVVEDSIRRRRGEAERARLLVGEELARFEQELSWILVLPLASEIYRSLEVVRRSEFERAVRKMGESDGRKISVMERFSKELVERIMQVPMERLKRAALNNEGELLSAAEKLFKNNRGGVAD
ncbi:MAG: glutamyl-tRNA reductase [Candidatus Bathyarchaeia archaeon]